MDFEAHSNKRLYGPYVARSRKGNKTSGPLCASTYDRQGQHILGQTLATPSSLQRVTEVPIIVATLKPHLTDRYVRDVRQEHVTLGICESTLEPGQVVFPPYRLGIQ
jgi:hypothetical protein